MGARLPLACCLLLSILVSVAGWHYGDSSGHATLSGVPDTMTITWDDRGNYYYFSGETCNRVTIQSSGSETFTAMVQSESAALAFRASGYVDATSHYDICGSSFSEGVTSCELYAPGLTPSDTYYVTIVNTNVPSGMLWMFGREDVTVTTTFYLSDVGCSTSGTLSSPPPPSPPPPSPRPPPATASTPAGSGSGLFAVTSGACTVAAGSTCFRSPNYPSDYGNYENCTITASEAVTLSVAAFSVEAETSCGFDSLTVNGNTYCGTLGPDGVQVAAGATITFTSDDAITSTGFEICGPPPPPPLVASASVTPPPDQIGLAARPTAVMWALLAAILATLLAA